MNRNRLILGMVLLFLNLTDADAQQKKYRLPAYRTEQEKAFLKTNIPQTEGLGKAGFIMPPNVRFPGEFEESQAVAISWSFDYDNNGNVIGVDTSSVYGYVSAQCAKYISDELPVWIRIPRGEDSVVIKTFMNNLGWPLTRNYRFFVTTGDDWWMRDYGPNGIYYGSKDSVGFVDLKYYDGRNADNIFPRYLASKLGYLNIESRLNAEGGNLVPDGFGKLFYSSVVTEVNTLSTIHSPQWNFNQTTDTVKNLFNITEPVNLPSLLCDGGTGHIDLYMKLIDEQTMIVAKYPDTVTAGDRQKIEDSYQVISAMKSTYNRPFRIYRIPMPTNDDGSYARTCTQLNNDARTYVNGITANKTFIYPSYSDDVDGNKQQTAEATTLFKKLMPGYKVVPIDSRALTPGGGAIHCITMQIPAENPVLFWHPSVDGLQPIQSSYHIVSKITNHSGIKKAECKWRKRSDPAWSTVTLTDSAGYFIGDIQPGTLTTSEWFVYYLTAETNNGKTAVKPITAPEGYYQVYFRTDTDSLSLLAEELRIAEKNHLFGAYPNPAATDVTIPFKLLNEADVTLQVTDITGRVIYTRELHTTKPGMHQVHMDISNWKPGMYFYSMYFNGEKLDTRRLSISR